MIDYIKLRSGKCAVTARVNINRSRKMRTTRFDGTKKIIKFGCYNERVVWTFIIRYKTFIWLFKIITHLRTYFKHIIVKQRFFKKHRVRAAYTIYNSHYRPATEYFHLFCFCFVLFECGSYTTNFHTGTNSKEKVTHAKFSLSIKLSLSRLT